MDLHRQSPSGLELVPAELKITLFCVLPDTESLKSLAFAVSSFYHILIDSQSLIVAAILSNGIYPEVLP